MGRSIEVVLVDACLRDGAGGSPTAVLTSGDGLGDAAMARIPPLAGTSHVAVIGPPVADGAGRTVRFFTSEGELPSCGHGTVAAIAVLAAAGGGYDGRLRAGGRDFAASATRDPATGDVVAGGVVAAWFDQGLVERGTADEGLVGAFLAALGLGTGDLRPEDEPTVASPGRPRLLLPVADRDVLAALRPDMERLAAESRRHGQLGCFVYAPPSATDRPAARMFAPAIGVPEDVANANSTGCLAAHLLATGRGPAVAVDQGDALGHPSTVYAAAERAPGGIATRVGGAARLAGSVRLTP
ncbi:MAG: PhzF family phenazine biosynthesis protein [Mycobacteriales bacterium]